MRRLEFHHFFSSPKFHHSTPYHHLTRQQHFLPRQELLDPNNTHHHEPGHQDNTITPPTPPNTISQTPKSTQNYPSPPLLYPSDAPFSLSPTRTRPDRGLWAPLFLPRSPPISLPSLLPLFTPTNTIHSLFSSPYIVIQSI